MTEVTERPAVQRTVETVPTPLVTVACAAALGVFLRVDGAGRKGLWLDEVLAAWRVSAPSTAALIDSLKGSPFPPLYYLALRSCVGLWGLGDFPLRSLSLAAGLAALPATYFVWCGLIGRRSACWAMAVLALNAFHINYSQDAKMYAAVWLLATVSGGAFLHSVLGTGGRRWLGFYGVSNALLPLVSYVGIVPLIVQALYLAWLYRARPGRRQAALGVGIVAALALLPSLFWLPVALPAAANRVGIAWIPPATWARVPGDLYRLIGIYLTGYEVTWGVPLGLSSVYLIVSQAACVAAVAWLLASGAVGVSRVGRAVGPGEATEVAARGPSEVVVYLALWLLLPVAGALAFSLSVYSVWGVPRYLAGAAPALLLWVGMGVGLRPGGRFERRLALPLLAANLVTIGFDRTHTTRAPWDEVARTVEAVGAALQSAGASSGGPGLEPRGLAVVVRNDLDPEFLQERCLEYAFARLGPEGRQVSPYFLPFGEAVREGGPFVAVELTALDGGARAPGVRGWAAQAEGRPDDLVSRLAFSDTVYARNDGLPAPFSPRDPGLGLHPTRNDCDDRLLRSPTQAVGRRRRSL